MAGDDLKHLKVRGLWSLRRAEGVSSGWAMPRDTTNRGIQVIRGSMVSPDAIVRWFRDIPPGMAGMVAIQKRIRVDRCLRSEDGWEAIRRREYKDRRGSVRRGIGRLRRARASLLPWGRCRLEIGGPFGEADQIELCGGITISVALFLRSLACRISRLKKESMSSMKEMIRPSIIVVA